MDVSKKYLNISIKKITFLQFLAYKVVDFIVTPNSSPKKYQEF
jgi:hypothetical protein